MQTRSQTRFMSTLSTKEKNFFTTFLEKGHTFQQALVLLNVQRETQQELALDTFPTIYKKFYVCSAKAKQKVKNLYEQEVTKHHGNEKKECDMMFHATETQIIYELRALTTVIKTTKNRPMFIREHFIPFVIRFSHILLDKRSTIQTITKQLRIKMIEFCSVGMLSALIAFSYLCPNMAVKGCHPFVRSNTQYENIYNDLTNPIYHMNNAYEKCILLVSNYIQK